MKKFTLLIITILLMALGLSAEDRQFYLIGKKEVVGSLSSVGSTQEGIYLRWDLIEGEMPSDIATLSLIRVDNESNTTLLNVTSDAHMDDANISAIYQERDSQRRLFEFIDALSKSDNPLCSDASVANIGEKVQGCLEQNAWSFLASRVDFNIARARYRAFLDTGYKHNAEFVEYILLGKDKTAQKSVILGKLRVDLKTNSSVLKATEVTQVIDSKCNDNRYGLDDGRVALYWKNGGLNTTEFFTNTLMVSGYDIYYSTLTSEKFKKKYTPEKINIAKMARERIHKENGSIDFSDVDLQKANETLITLGAQDGNSSIPLYVETQEALEKMGFIPGEKRYYFIVPRDFTGNYGPTEYIEVLIPNLLPPVAPINPRVVETKGKASLIWDGVSFQNYALHHQNDMQACTTQTILTSSRVKFVPKGEACSTSEGIVLNFNVKNYYVYRFESAVEAAGFEDLDLDGYNDVNETVVQGCEKVPNVGAKNYLVATVNHTNNKTITFIDAGLEKGKVYWYRIVSATADGVISTQTAPIRAFIPYRELLAAPVVNASYDVIKITTPINEQGTNDFVQDHLSKVSHIRLVFQGHTYDIALSSGVATLSNALKAHHFSNVQRTGLVSILFMQESETIESRNFYLNTMFNFSTHKDDKDEYFTIESTKRYFDISKQSLALADGIVVEGGCVELTLNDSFIENLQGNGCIETSIAIGNRRYKKSLDCNITQIKEICETTLNGDMVSIGIRKVMHNGLYSSSSYINFVPGMELPVPNKPSLKSIGFNKEEQKAVVTIRPQVEKVTGTLLSFYKQGDESRSFIHTETHIGQNDVENEINAPFSNLGLLEDYDVWCVKAKTIGLDRKVSEWSSPLCQRIEALGEELDNLAWPALGEVTLNEERLPIAFNETTQRVQIMIDATTADVETHVEAKIDDGDYSRVVAEDTIDATKELEVSFYKAQEKVETVSISKSADNRFYLPFKTATLATNEIAESITSMRLEFITNEGEALFETSVQLKRENLLKMDESQLVVNQRVSLENNSTENECSLIESVNALNRDFDYVVYRQTLGSDSASNFVQVTPLMQESTCNKEGTRLEKSNNIEVSSDGTQRIVNFVDRYPYIVGKTYKYVVVFFGKDSGEPVSYTLTTPESIEID